MKLACECLDLMLIDSLSSWLKALGVRVINTRLSFADEIPRAMAHEDSQVQGIFSVQHDAA